MKHHRPSALFLVLVCGVQLQAEDANPPRSARVSDPAETSDRRSPGNQETFGQAGGSVGRPATARPVRLLFAGSSSTYWNDMPREVAALVSGKLADRPGVAVEPEMVGRSGSDIRVYLEPGFDRYEYGVKPGQTFLNKIRDERPQFVVLQTVCSFITDEDSGSAHAAAVTRYCTAIRAAGGEPVFYEMGWGKSDREAEGRRRILELALQNRIRLYAPCSTAWARVYRQRPDLALQHPQDSSHPGNLGHFLNLACFYAALTGESPVGKLPRTYHVWPHARPKPQTDAEKAAVAKELAGFQPDAYQAKMAKWMFRNMAADLTQTLDESTAIYLETIGWEESQRIRNCLTRQSRNGTGDRDRQRIKTDGEWLRASSAVSFYSLPNSPERALK